MSKQIELIEPAKEYRFSSEDIKKYLETETVQPGSIQPKPYQRGVLTGAFDPYHYAHGKAIQQAASLCEQLIVAVSTDDVIRGYKGEPLLPFEKRLEAISYVKGVTLAIPQYDLYNKLEMLQDLGADVLFSCEEYQRSYYSNPEEMTPKEIAGVERWERFEQEANEVGIDVVNLPRNQEMSSTIMKQLLIAKNQLHEPQGVMLYSEGECCNEPFVSL